MAIDLSAYTPRKRKHLRQVKACCVYVIGESNAGPMKIGIAGDIVQRFKQIDESGSAKQAVHYLMWTPGRPVATRIENYTHSLLLRAGRGLKGEWFNVDLETAKMTIKWAARELYPNASLYSHEKIIAQLEKKVMERPRKYAAVDSLQQINDIPEISGEFGSLSSTHSSFKNPVRDVAQMLEDEGHLIVRKV
ncbi:GIY-YIG nuclease family protein [Bradyrhizobium sp. UFLA03-84]|uniref:GIY-YIG nuclease family protein n=1 Tax=Bradyrhizobium sp. UFLA03-84 TaxID=418599 RepID=UPI001304320B|nr:GIY-YIG nuclease family protein [Bradyrhizobium sp. UFLA03-84]